MTKISALPQDTAPTLSDSIPTYDLETATTKRATISDLITLFFNNIPVGSGSPVTRFDEAFFDFVTSGLVWTADSAGVNRNASMTAGIVYINGRRISIALVTARTFTASKDTYVDVLDNLDGTGTLVYTETTNNAASAALAANSIRIGIIVTGASAIAAAASINQGQHDRVLPIASSIAYTVTDSLGNLICNRSAYPVRIGYRQIVGNVSLTAPTSPTDITGLSCPVIVPTGRQVRISLHYDSIATTAAAGTALQTHVTETNSLARGILLTGGANWNEQTRPSAVLEPSAGLHTYKGQGATASGNFTITADAGNASSTSIGPAYIIVELIG